MAFDISMSSFDERVLQALDALTPEVWICIFKDTTSPITLLIGLDRSVLDRGIGQIGSISIPPFIWNFLAPEDFESVASRDLGSMRSMSEDGLVMARALVHDGVLSVWEGGGGANGYMFPVPKNSTKASMIVHLVKFNKAHEHKPASFGLPSVEDLALMVQVHSLQLPRLALGDVDYLRFLSDPFLQSLECLRVESEPGAPLVACHVDLTNTFWSLRLPDHLRGAFRVCIDGKVYGFNCLPFGWQYSPIVC